MKHNNQRNPRKKTFLRLPSFPGGKEAYLKFIHENIIYPDQALENKIEGLVYISYTVNNIGEIDDVIVTKGVGYGCDEEAIRVIRLLTYEPVRNRGVKMKVEMKTRIQFKLPSVVNPVIQPSEMHLNYTAPAGAKSNSPEPKPQAVYNYTIKLS